MGRFDRSSKSSSILDWVGLLNWFSVSELKFLVRLVLIEVYVLALGRSLGLFLLYVLNSFFKQMLKLFLFLPISQVFVLVKFFWLEYHICGYLTMNGNYQNHVDSNIVLLGSSRHCLVFEHCLSDIFVRAIINFMFNRILDEVINDGTRFVCFSMTSFVTRFISYTTTRLGRNSSHNYLLVFKFVVWIV